jgi:hypothetical protein
MSSCIQYAASGVQLPSSRSPDSLVAAALPQLLVGALAPVRGLAFTDLAVMTSRVPCACVVGYDWSVVGLCLVVEMLVDATAQQK